MQLTNVGIERGCSMAMMHLKILGTGEIVKWKDFSEITQLYVVESADGKIWRVQSNKISRRVTAEEAREFERGRVQTVNVA